MPHVERLPFTVNRNDARSLLDQVSDGLREAITCGRWKPGDEIPSSRELVDLLGVSRIVTKAALARLAAEGHIVSRTGLKPVVSDRGEKRWRGHVVLVYDKRDGDNYLKTRLAASLQDRLTENGWLLSQTSVSTQVDGKCDFSLLDVVLSRSVDLVIVMFRRPEICAYLAKRKMPYVVFSGEAAMPPTAAGAIRYDHNLANGDFAAACKAAGVNEVVMVDWCELVCDVAPALRKAGIKVKKIRVPVDESEGRLIGVKRAGRHAFAKMLRSDDALAVAGRCFFIADDYLTEGALLALSCAGLKAPDDVRLATWANAGLGPDYTRPLSRMEMDPFEVGEKVAAAVIEYFKTGKFPVGVVVGPTWIAGETI